MNGLPQTSPSRTRVRCFDPLQYLVATKLASHKKTRMVQVLRMLDLQVDCECFKWLHAL
jgi:hypothetical protein